MTPWITTLSWLQLCWLVYGGLLVALGLLVWYIEYHARKVDGASGWSLFSWMLFGAYGLAILLGLSALNWFLKRC